MKILFLLGCLGIMGSESFGDQGDWQSFDREKISVEKIFQHKGVIWGFDFLSDDELIFSKREGELFHYNMKTRATKELLAPKVYAKGQGGLLDVMVHGKEVYVTYSKPVKDSAATAVARGTWQGNDLPRLETIFESNATSSSSIHFGSRLVVRGDELFMTIGDRNDRDKAQDLSQHHGKTLRLTLDGRPYANNPFKEKGLPEIYSYGHRNPQGLALHPKSSELYMAEFGPKGGDEVNLILPSKNYGWPLVTYGTEYHGPKIGKEQLPGMEPPLVYYTPAISPSGLEIYSGAKNAQFAGNFFLAALGNQYVHRLVLDDKQQVVLQQKWLEDLDERIRQIKEGPDGHLYFSTDSGKFYRILMDKIKIGKN